VHRLKGIYVLIIQVIEDTDINVGALGKLSFKKGLYAYVGSAQNNLEYRIKRHLRKKKPKFWHVDYLLDNAAAKIVNTYFKKAKKSDECKTAAAIRKKGKPITGFGCSDCNCNSHLFQIANHSLPFESMQLFSAET
jgi:Uri superfamily endonuclease